MVTPLLFKMLGPVAGETYLDMGCGEGRVMRAITEMGATAHGVDLSYELMSRVIQAVVGDAMSLPFDDATYNGVYCVLTLEHIEDHVRFFREAARVVMPGGRLALVSNHPIWTAPGSTPSTDQDGEVLWRSGEYFSRGSSEVPAGEDTVTFYHRSMSELLNAAAEAAWSLEKMAEQPHHEYEDQAGIPRLLGCRWVLFG